MRPLKIIHLPDWCQKKELNTKKSLGLFLKNSFISLEDSLQSYFPGSQNPENSGLFSALMPQRSKLKIISLKIQGQIQKNTQRIKEKGIIQFPEH